MNSDIRTSRYGLGMIMKTGWAEFIKNWKTIIPITLLVYIPVNLICLWIPEKLSNIMYIVTLLVTISLARIIEGSVQNKQISILYALNFALMRWRSVCWAWILLALLFIVLLVCLVIPVIIFFPYFTFAIYAVSLRGISGGKGLDYSNDLVKGQWWRVVRYIIAIDGLAVLISIFLIWFSNFIPENTFGDFIVDTFLDLVWLPFIAMEIIFFLNCDYLKHKPADIPEQL